MGHPPLERECLGSPNGREAGRREGLQGKREGPGPSAAFSKPSESLGPLGNWSCHLGLGGVPREHCRGAGLTAGRTGG